MIFVKTFTLADFAKFKNLPKESAQFSTFLTQNIDFFYCFFLRNWNVIPIYNFIFAYHASYWVKSTVKSQKMFNKIRNFTQLDEILH